MPVKKYVAKKRIPEPGERFQVGIRLTHVGKQRLSDAAERTGRSQSQEAEIRLEHSFDREDLLTEVLSLTYGRRVAGILQLLGSAMLHSGVKTLLAAAGGPLADGNVADYTEWTTNPDAFEQARRSVVAVLERFRPEGEITNPRGMAGELVAEDIIGALTENSTEDGWARVPNYSWDRETVKRLLGPPLVARMAEPRPTAERCPMCDQSLPTDKADDSQA
jgi:hypothetical protein